MFKKIVLGVLGLFIASAALTVVLPRSGEAQIGSTPVRVVNTPLPIAGNVNATVSGNVGLAPGAMVGVSGPVKIDNSAGPVVVRDDGSGEFVRLSYDLHVYEPDYSVEEKLYTVPADRVFIVEHTSATAYLPTGQNWARYSLVSFDPPNGSWFHDYLVPTKATSGAVYDRFSLNHQTRMYLFENAELWVSVSREDTTGAGGCTGYVVGRLVPMP
jgi:hypothetical protein